MLLAYRIGDASFLRWISEMNGLLHYHNYCGTTNLYDFRPHQPLCAFFLPKKK